MLIEYLRREWKVWEQFLFSLPDNFRLQRDEFFFFFRPSSVFNFIIFADAGYAYRIVFRLSKFAAVVLLSLLLEVKINVIRVFSDNISKY